MKTTASCKATCRKGARENQFSELLHLHLLRSLCLPNPKLHRTEIGRQNAGQAVKDAYTYNSSNLTHRTEQRRRLVVTGTSRDQGQPQYQLQTEQVLRGGR